LETARKRQHKTQNSTETGIDKVLVYIIYAPPPLPPVAYLKFSDASRLINSFLPLRLPTHYETPLSFLAMMNLTAPLPYPDSIRQNPHFRLYDLDPAVDFTPTNLDEAHQSHRALR